MPSDKKIENHSFNIKSLRERLFPKLTPYMPYLVTFLTMWAIYFYLFSKQLINNEATISLCMRTILLMLILHGVYLAYEHKLTMEHLIMLCILGGLVMRMGYAFYTPFHVRSHDLGAISFDDAGHAAYIYHLLENHKLPDSYSGQFYHPPLFHFLAFIFVNLFAKVHPEADINTLYEVIKLVSCFASCSVLFLIRSLCRELKCKPEMTCIIIALIAFCPNFYLLAGRVNNDSVAVAWMVFSFTMLVKWYHSRKFSQLIGMAVGIGLGMMTKLNVAILAFVAGPVMLYVLWQAVREKKWKGLFVQYCIFIAVCAPLGLWYSIRNYILFKMPFGYVLNLDVYGAETVIDKLGGSNGSSFFKRFLSLPWKEFLTTPYCNPDKDYSIPLYIVRSSLFGEFQFENMDRIALQLVFVNFILILLSIAAMIAVVWKGKKLDPMLRYGCGIWWLVFMISYMMFNIKYPYGCTMDFRYIVPAVITGSIFLAAFWQMLREYLGEQVSVKRNQKMKYYAAKVLIWLIPLCCIFYAVLSTYMYSNLS